MQASKINRERSQDKIKKGVGVMEKVELFKDDVEKAHAICGPFKRIHRLEVFK